MKGCSECGYTGHVMVTCPRDPDNCSGSDCCTRRCVECNR